MSGRRSVASAVRALVVAAVLATGCGVPTEASPREIAVDDVPFGLLDDASSAEEPDPGPGTRTATLYFVADGPRLQEVERNVSTDGGLTATEFAVRVMSALLDGRTDNDPAGTSSFLTGGVELLSVEITGTESEVLSVDLAGELPVGEAQAISVAQLVYTAAAIPNIDALELRLEGELARVPTDTGPATGLLTPQSYGSIAPVGFEF